MPNTIPGARLAGMLVATFAMLLAAACGAGTPDSSSGGASEPHPTDVTPPGAGSWSTDVPLGARTGLVAFPSSVKLRDGTTQTLEEIAAGRPMLLYFFATW